MSANREERGVAGVAGVGNHGNKMSCFMREEKRERGRERTLLIYLYPGNKTANPGSVSALLYPGNRNPYPGSVSALL